MYLVDLSDMIGGRARQRAGRWGRRALACLLAAFLTPLAISAPTAAASGPAVCPAGQAASTAYLDSFESAELGWRAERLSGGGRLAGGESGQLAGSHWYFPPSQPGLSPWDGVLNIWADILPASGSDRQEASESTLEMRSDLTLPAAARLSFVHRFDFAAVPGSYGAVEYSLDGGASWRLFGTFSGSVDGHRSTHIDLAEFSGRGLRLRFRVAVPAATAPPAADPSVFRGWAIDDVHFYSCAGGPGGPGGPAEPPGPPALPVNSQPRLSGSGIGLAISRRPVVLKRGARYRLRVTVSNYFPRALRRVRVCLRAPAALVLGRRCTVIRRLPGRSAADLAFAVRIRAGVAKRRSRLPVRFIAREGSDLQAMVLRRYRLAAG